MPVNTVHKKTEQVFWTLADLGEELNLTRSGISMRYSRNQLPDPDAFTKSGRPLWTPDKAKAYVKAETAP